MGSVVDWYYYIVIQFALYTEWPKYGKSLIVQYNNKRETKIFLK